MVQVPYHIQTHPPPHRIPPPPLPVSTRPVSRCQGLLLEDALDVDHALLDQVEIAAEALNLFRVALQDHVRRHVVVRSHPRARPGITRKSFDEYDRAESLSGTAYSGLTYDGVDGMLPASNRGDKEGGGGGGGVGAGAGGTGGGGGGRGRGGDRQEEEEDEREDDKKAEEEKA